MYVMLTYLNILRDKKSSQIESTVESRKIMSAYVCINSLDNIVDLLLVSPYTVAKNYMLIFCRH